MHFILNLKMSSSWVDRKLPTKNFWLIKQKQSYKFISISTQWAILFVPSERSPTTHISLHEEKNVCWWRNTPSAQIVRASHRPTMSEKFSLLLMNSFFFLSLSLSRLILLFNCHAKPRTEWDRVGSSHRGMRSSEWEKENVAINYSKIHLDSLPISRGF